MKSAKSKMPPETRLPSIVTCFSSRCQPRGRTCSVATLSLRRYVLLPAAVSCANESVRRIACAMLIWPWIWFVHSGEFESSKSVMYESAPEL